ncbi:hypothetical protein BDV98DRAFT_586680 [Pterulicium gracile]|uniref:Uncharacterized protein n=1 Tax=Pterulicium gracile TaxID=1884261 RepID=A0A5C3Q6K7_9AGAR|nr:hypothetical protein BDV98DRAFT_586680 [Pterula gracilis]
MSITSIDIPDWDALMCGANSDYSAPPASSACGLFAFDDLDNLQNPTAHEELESTQDIFSSDLYSSHAPSQSNDTTAVSGGFEGVSHGSGLLRLDTVCFYEGVYSELKSYPKGLEITKKTVVKRVEHIHGLPTQLLVPRKHTGFVLDLTGSVYSDLHGWNGDILTVGAAFKNQNVHLWGGTPGKRARVGAHLPSAIFGLESMEDPVPCRHFILDCKGIYGCNSLSKALKNVELYKLNPTQRTILMDADFYQWLTVLNCPAKNENGECCQRKLVMRRFATQTRGKNFFLICPNQLETWDTDH